MHVLHVIDSLSVGGAERMLVDLVNATIRDGKHRASVCVTRQGTALASELHPSVNLWVLNRQRRMNAQALRRLSKITRQEQVDVLHAHGRSTLAFLAVARAMRLIGLPVVMHDHNGSIEIDATIPLWFRVWGRFHLTQYVGVYQRCTEWALRAGVPQEQARTIGNALDFTRLDQARAADLRAEWGLDARDMIGVVVCGIRYEKGIDTLIEAIARVPAELGFTVVIIGGDRDKAYADKCRTRVKELGLEKQVLFVGERVDVPAMIKGADFAIIPSRSESGPLVLIEYLYAGLPFISTKVGGIARQVESSGMPTFIPPDSPDAIASAIWDILTLPADVRHARGKQGQDIAETLYDVRMVMPDWYAVYEAALS